MKVKTIFILDQGVNMSDCAQVFYDKMDSLLNIVYRSAMSKCNGEQKADLKQRQLKWLKQRDNYFKRIPSETRKELPLRGSDYEQSE